jgi:hypothetical protein
LRRARLEGCLLSIWVTVLLVSSLNRLKGPVRRRL